MRVGGGLPVATSRAGLVPRVMGRPLAVGRPLAALSWGSRKQKSIALSADFPAGCCRDAEGPAVGAPPDLDAGCADGGEEARLQIRL